MRHFHGIRSFNFRPDIEAPTGDAGRTSRIFIAFKIANFTMKIIFKRLQENLDVISSVKDSSTQFVLLMMAKYTREDLPEELQLTTFFI